ncbi:unnamed protein product [Trifolium pratense]|uniref:Uncharacterized protein n=1 Tax=Trifolium pratense TaxID=57577 RepID=A0ACB0IVG2_TRIPR|nr:unnamed protein product [Trifolium pratense]
MKMRTQKTFMFLLLLSFLFADYVSVSASLAGTLGKAAEEIAALKKSLPLITPADWKHMNEMAHKAREITNYMAEEVIKLRNSGCLSSSDIPKTITAAKLFEVVKRAIQKQKRRDC